MRKNITQTFSVGKSGSVTRSGTAKWSALNAANGTFPIVIATCAIAGLTYNTKVTFHAKNYGGCNNPSGQFGWTDIDCSTPSSPSAGPTMRRRAPCAVRAPT